MVKLQKTGKVYSYNAEHLKKKGGKNILQTKHFLRKQEK
jgi:hypothetical protein